MAWGREKELHSFARFNSHFGIQVITQNKGLPGARQIVFIWRPRPNLASATSAGGFLQIRSVSSPLPQTYSSAFAQRTYLEGSYPLLSAAFSVKTG